MISPRVNFRLPKDELQDVDQLIKEGKFKNRSDFFTTATTQLLGKIALEGKPA